MIGIKKTGTHVNLQRSAPLNHKHLFQCRQNTEQRVTPTSHLFKDRRSTPVQKIRMVSFTRGSLLTFTVPTLCAGWGEIPTKYNTFPRNAKDLSDVLCLIPIFFCPFIPFRNLSHPQCSYRKRTAKHLDLGLEVRDPVIFTLHRIK